MRNLGRIIGGATVTAMAAALTIPMTFSASESAIASPAVHAQAIASPVSLHSLIATPDGPPWGPCGC